VQSDPPEPKYPASQTQLLKDDAPNALVVEPDGHAVH